MIQVRGRAALALAFANQNADGTFTAPTIDVRRAPIIPAGSIHILPLGDSVQLYGRPVRKAGDTASNSVQVSVVEFR